MNSASRVFGKGPVQDAATKEAGRDTGRDETMLRYAMVMAAALLAAGAATAQTGDAGGGKRTVSVTVYGSDPCPRGGDGEIVVCGRRPDNERYRIPKELRKREQKPSETSWASRVAGLEEAGRASMPGSCSPVGSWGQSGCFQQMIRQWGAARAAARSQAANVP
jgi:hypothetical protein